MRPKNTLGQQTQDALSQRLRVQPRCPEDGMQQAMPQSEEASILRASQSSFCCLHLESRITAFLSQSLGRKMLPRPPKSHRTAHAASELVVGSRQVRSVHREVSELGPDLICASTALSLAFEYSAGCFKCTPEPKRTGWLQLLS